MDQWDRLSDHALRGGILGTRLTNSFKNVRVLAIEGVSNKEPFPKNRGRERRGAQLFPGM